MTAVSYRFLDQRAAVAAFAASLPGEAAVAIDFEADSLHSYREKICLAQVSTRADHAVLDPLTDPGVLEDLRPVLAAPGVLKVFHGSDYDIRLLKRTGIGVIANLFDTMVAAQLLGRPRVGLAALLEEHFGVTLDKRHQRANWGARPLTADMLAYAAADTAHLLALRDLLEAELRAAGRLLWAREEFALLETLEPALPKPPWCLDVKGASGLSPRQLAVLQGLLAVRDEAARELDRPPFKVLSNEVLLAWAVAPPKTRAAVVETRGAGPGLLARLSDRLLAAIRGAEALPEGDCPRPRSPTHEPLDDAQERLLKRLKQARGKAGERLGIEVGLLVNSATLERLVRLGPAEAPGALPRELKGWQLEAVGEDLRGALVG